MSFRPCWPLVVSLLLPAAHARADDAAQAVGLFMQSCVRFVGDTAGLRQWAAQTGLKPLPPGGQAAFLQHQPGIAFDATNADGKFVVISGEAGSCSTVAQRADAARLTSDLEQALTESAIGFGIVADADDPTDEKLHHREYRARKGDRSWRIVLSTGAADSGAHPMLTAIPE